MPYLFLHVSYAFDCKKAQHLISWLLASKKRPNKRHQHLKGIKAVRKTSKLQMKGNYLRSFRVDFWSVMQVETIF